MFVIFRDLCLFGCYPTLMLKVDHAQKEAGIPFQLPALYKGTAHASRLERIPPKLYSKETRVNPWPFKIHVSPVTTFSIDVVCMVSAM